MTFKNLRNYSPMALEALVFRKTYNYSAQQCIGKIRGWTSGLHHQQYCRFGSGLDRFRLNFTVSFNFRFQFSISAGRDQQQIPRTVANADRWLLLYFDILEYFI